MASPISPLSYLNTSPYLSLPATSTGSAAGTAVSATAEFQALQKQGDFQSFMNNSIAAALLQPADGINSGTTTTTLVNNMLQEVLGSYQAQTTLGGASS